MKQIIVTIDLDGNATVEAVGFNGKGCKDATKAIEEAVGTVTNVKQKPEFYRQEVQTDVRNRA